jgi:DNA polymerase-3 subunit epsilon
MTQGTQIRKRSVVFDTETTGLSPQDGDRIIEIGCVELLDLIPTGRVLHTLINPERPIPADATRIHGITNADVKEKPVFSEVIEDLRDFLGDAEIVAHNASFDMAFMHAEFDRLSEQRLTNLVVDTLILARRQFSGSASLDALCKRFGIDLSSRQNHGALIDAKLLARVYLELCGGANRRLALEVSNQPGGNWRSQDMVLYAPRPIGLATDDERLLHAAFMEQLLGANKSHAPKF